MRKQLSGNVGGGIKEGTEKAFTIKQTINLVKSNDIIYPKTHDYG